MFRIRRWIISVNKPLIGKLEKEKLLECIESGWISSEGPYVTEFEDKFKKIVEEVWDSCFQLYSCIRHCSCSFTHY